MSRGTSGTFAPLLATEPTHLGQPGGRYIPQLDGLRTVAIGLVLVHHAVSPALFGGFLGVDVFFVISGYLITAILLREVARTGAIRLRRFYVRRMLRLYPPLFAMVLVMSIPAVLVSKHMWWLIADTGVALTYLTPIALQWNDGISIIYRHTWSLGIEEMFYLAWPALLLVSGIARSRRAAMWIALLCGASLLIGCIIQVQITGSMSYLLRAGGILIGCALALALEHFQSKVSALVGWAGALGLAGAVCTASFGRPQAVAVAAAVLASTALVAHLATDGTSLLSRGLAVRSMAYLGRISYELYLWHYAIFEVLSRWQHTTFNHVAWLALPLSFAVAMISHGLLTPWIARWKLKIETRPIATESPQVSAP